MRIQTLDENFFAEHVERETKQLVPALMRYECASGVGLLVDNSVYGILLVRACIQLGLRVAIAPLREPAEVVARWCCDLGIRILFTSIKDCEPYDPCSVIFVDDLLKANSDPYTLSARSEFTSLLKTSGTTATPKTAILPARAHWASARGVCHYFSFDETSTWALSLPLYHVSGLSIVFRAMHADAAIFLASSLEDIIAGIKKGAITHLSLVPTQLYRLLQRDIDLRGLKAIVIGGDAMSQTLRTHVRAHGLRVYETYGLTETASMIWVYDVINQSGCLLPHARMRIDDDNDEILVGGDSLFDGYYSSTPAFDGEYFRTGDRGAMLDNELRIFGRTHHRIISGGENIQAEEVERIIEQHPGVETCVVIGVPDHDLGMRLYAIIKWTDTPRDTSDVIAFLRRQIAAYKIPRTIISWPNDAPVSMKKPRRWLQSWLQKEPALDKSVIVCA